MFSKKQYKLDDLIKMKILWTSFLLDMANCSFQWFSKKNRTKLLFSTNDLVTAPEIMFFWVARMIISGHE